MSASLWDCSSASVEGLLTNEECSILLDYNIFDDDLLKPFPAAVSAPAREAARSADDSSLYPPSPPEHKPRVADIAAELLLTLDNPCKQENIFPNWLEEKVELPIFEHIPPPLAFPPAPAPAPLQPTPTAELLREFETVYGAVELTHLTPPQSPPGPATQLLLTYAQQAQCAPPAWLPAPAPAPAFDPELQLVDELVARAAELSPAGLHSSSSAASSPPSSPRSVSTDDEWAAPTRGKPYDRRSRKKEQNKNAATRYRQKKKAEIEVLASEESALRAQHAALAERGADLQREVRYLKGLMRDLFKAKGLIK